MKEEIGIEERTLEELLKDLREQKNWTYLHIVEELNQLGLIVDEKKIKKWEIGLEYPDLDVIYKLSELYLIPSENFIIAKNNSYKQGLESIHMVFIKWICYFTGISLKVGIVALYVVIAITLVWSLLFFIDKTQTFLEVRKIMNH